jgi:hypothetical protein
MCISVIHTDEHRMDKRNLKTPVRTRTLHLTKPQDGAWRGREAIAEEALLTMMVVMTMITLSSKVMKRMMIVSSKITRRRMTMMIVLFV